MTKKNETLLIFSMITVIVIVAIVIGTLTFKGVSIVSDSIKPKLNVYHKEFSLSDIGINLEQFAFKPAIITLLDYGKPVYIDQTLDFSVTSLKANGYCPIISGKNNLRYVVDITRNGALKFSINKYKIDRPELTKSLAVDIGDTIPGAFVKGFIPHETGYWAIQSFVMCDSTDFAAKTGIITDYDIKSFEVVVVPPSKPLVCANREGLCNYENNLELWGACVYDGVSLTWKNTVTKKDGYYCSNGQWLLSNTCTETAKWITECQTETLVCGKIVTRNLFSNSCASGAGKCVNGNCNIENQCLVVPAYSSQCQKTASACGKTISRNTEGLSCFIGEETGVCTNEQCAKQTTTTTLPPKCLTQEQPRCSPDEQISTETQVIGGCATTIYTCIKKPNILGFLQDNLLILSITIAIIVILLTVILVGKRK